MIPSPVGELSRNEKKKKKSDSVMKTPISGHRDVTEGAATSSQISHNILSHIEHGMFIPPPASYVEFFLEFLDLQNIFCPCSLTCSY